MALGFYRVEGVEGDKTKQRAQSWSGLVLLPLVDPSSAAGQWLSSAEGRRQLDLMTGDAILLIYPDEKQQAEYLNFLETMCEVFASHDRDIRRLYPGPGLVLISTTKKQCVVARIKSGTMGKAAEEDIVRRGLERVIRAGLAGGMDEFMLRTESRVLDYVDRLESAAPVLTELVRRVVAVNDPGKLAKRLVEVIVDAALAD